MSRSRRKTPIRGLCGHTEKWDKIFWHRRMRRMERIAIFRGTELMPLVHEAGNNYTFNKDGKIWWGNSKWLEDDPELKRKLLKK